MLLEGIAEVVVSLWVVGLELKRGVVGIDGCIWAASFLTGIS